MGVPRFAGRYVLPSLTLIASLAALARRYFGAASANAKDFATESQVAMYENFRFSTRGVILGSFSRASMGDFLTSGARTDIAFVQIYRISPKFT